MIYGYDVSNYQVAQFPLSDTVTKQPIDFVIIKVTEGTGYENPKWVAQRDWARTNGLSVGYYHFAHTGRTQAQADYFLSRLGPLQPGEHLWYDWESNPADGTHPTNAEKDDWIRYVRQQRPGHRVGLYCNTHSWKNLDRTNFVGDALWIATGGIPAGQPPIEAEWLIHQHSTANSIDHNVARFTSRAEMKAWAGAEDGMALTEDDVRRIFRTDGIIDAPDKPAENPHWAAASYIRETYLKARAAEAGHRKTAGALTEIRELIARGGMDEAFWEALVERIATRTAEKVLDGFSSRTAE